MKTFHYELGHVAGKTVTVKELINILESFDGDMPVMATWEGVNAYIEKEDFSIERVNKWKKEEACDCVVIDVGHY